MPLPWMHLRPASITSHLEESIMIGTRAISGSPAIRFRKRTIEALLSSMASSMLMSMTWAPFSTCWRATDSASSKRPSRIMRAKALEPVTLVRSPTLTNSVPGPMCTGSSPDSRIGAIWASEGRVPEGVAAVGVAGELMAGILRAARGRIGHSHADEVRLGEGRGAGRSAPRDLLEEDLLDGEGAFLAHLEAVLG